MSVILIHACLNASLQDTRTRCSTFLPLNLTPFRATASSMEPMSFRVVMRLKVHFETLTSYQTYASSGGVKPLIVLVC